MPSIPVLSLLVAGLAVFVGPIITWRIARRQIDSARRIATLQVVAPMRQAWINQLRKLIAELLANTLYFYVTGFEDRTDAEYQRLGALREEIELMLNPGEAQHEELAAAIGGLIAALNLHHSKERGDVFPPAHKRVKALAQSILKAEWNRTKVGD